MSVFWVLTPAIGPNGKNFGIVFEHEAASIAELSSMLAHDQIVAGNQLATTDDGRGGKLVKSRKPVAFTAMGIAAIMQYEYRCWEPET